MKKSGPVLVLLLVMFCFVPACTNPFAGRGGPIEAEYSLEPLSSQYNLTTEKWEVEYNVTVTITNLNKNDPAYITYASVSAYSTSRTLEILPVYPVVSFYESVPPGKSVTRTKTSSATLTDGQFDTLAAGNYRLHIVVDGFE